MRTAGIIGGLGPETTADFYMRINQLAQQNQEMDRPACLIWNVPLHYELEDRVIHGQEKLDTYIPYMVEAAHVLERAGVDFIAVPCNTVHEIFNGYADTVNVPVLHIVHETVKQLKQSSVKQIGLLATGATVQSGLYAEPLTQAGISCQLPSQEQQNHLDDIVSHLVHGTSTGEEREWVQALVEDQMGKLDAVVLGCTDFHIVFDDIPAPVPIIDSMEALAQASYRGIYEKT